MKSVILITIIISFCSGNEVFTNYSLNQNLSLESIPAKPVPRRATAGIIAAEFGGGLVGGAGGLIIGGVAGLVLAGIVFGSSLTDEGDIAGGISSFTLAAIGCTFGCAGGTYLVGSAFHQNGRFGPTLIGTLIGLPCLGVGAPFGSVIGYNKSRPKTSKQTFLYQHLYLPAFSFRPMKTNENKIIPVYDLRLVNARF